MEFKLRKNDNPKRPALEMVTEFYDFLQGESPEKIIILKGHMPKMSKKKAMAIIWYLQEVLPVLPDSIERCDNCGGLFDYNESGIHWQSKSKFFCDGCEHLVPQNYDRGKR